MKHRKILLVTTALVASGMFGGMALADGLGDADVAVIQPDPDAQTVATAQAQQAQNQDNSTSVAGVVVSVTKRAENVEDVPVAVTAYTPEQRDVLGVQSIFDFTRATPSFEYSTTLDRSFIRGVGRNTNAPGTQAGVAVYVDGVYTSSTYGLDRAPILSGTFEEDAGPQSTLFGRNSIGGILQQNSAHATDHFQTQVDLRYNDHNRFDEAATIGGPLNDDFKLLLGTDIRNQTEGYFHNLYLGNDTGGPTSERLYYSMLDFKKDNWLDGFWKLEFTGFNRKLSGFSQYGSQPTEVNPFFNDYSTGSTALNLNQYTNCAAVAGPAATVPGNFYSTTNPQGFVPGTVQLISNSYSLHGYQSLPLAQCGATQPQATTYYDPTNPAATNPFNYKNDFQTFAKSKNDWDTAFQNTWHLPTFDIHYIGGYNQYIYDNRQDGDGTARGVWTYEPGGPAGVAAGTAPAVQIFPIVTQYYEDRHWYTHELEFSSTGKNRLNWIFGVYYYNDSFHNITDNWSTGQTQLANTVMPFTATPGAINPNHNYYDLDYLALTQSTSAHGQFDYAITDKWKFTGGISFNHDAEQTVENDHYFVFVPGSAYSYYNGKGYVTSDATSLFGIGATCSPASNPIIPDCRTVIDPTHGLNERFINDGWHGWGGTANLTWQPNDDTLAYIKYSKGYKAGGIVLSSMNAQPLLAPESLNSYEAGYKFSPSRVVTVNLSAYYYDYRNYQDFGSVPNPQSRTGFSTVGFNIPKSRNYGAEITADWHPVHALTFTLTGDYLNAKVVDGGNIALVDSLDPQATGQVQEHLANGQLKTLTYTPQKCATSPTGTIEQCINGDALKGASPWKVWFNTDYRLDFSKGSLDLVANYSARAGNVSTYSQDPVYKAPSYNETDIRFVWQGSGSKYQFIGFVDNIFNQVGTEYVTAASDSSQPAGTAAAIYINRQLTIPRTWGLELQAKF